LFERLPARAAATLAPTAAPYEDAWLRDRARPAAWYAARARDREYFYCVDSLGRLFLEETNPKSIATSLKSPKFLDFFFARLRARDPDRRRSPGDTPAAPSPHPPPPLADYPFVSPCGSERNFVVAADTPLVAHDLHFADPAAPHPTHLVVAATIHIPLDRSRFLLSDEGRLYFDAPSDPHHHVAQLGPLLIASPLALSISAHLTILRDDLVPLPGDDQAAAAAIVPSTPRPPPPADPDAPVVATVSFSPTDTQQHPVRFYRRERFAT
jgi:hypothetical protein